MRSLSHWGHVAEVMLRSCLLPLCFPVSDISSLLQDVFLTIAMTTKHSQQKPEWNFLILDCKCHNHVCRRIFSSSKLIVLSILL